MLIKKYFFIPISFTFLPDLLQITPSVFLTNVVYVLEEPMAAYFLTKLEKNKYFLAYRYILNTPGSAVKYLIFNFLEWESNSQPVSVYNRTLTYLRHDWPKSDFI